MLLKKCISAVLTAMIVSVCSLAAPFMNVSCVHETDAGLISKCVLQCSYDSKEPGTIRITVKTQALAVMDSIGVTGLVLNRYNENSGYYEFYKRLGLYQERSARYALIDNMKVDAPAGNYHITCVHFASGRTKTLDESEQLVNNETYVRVEEDAPAPTSPPVTTTITSKRPVTTTTAPKNITGRVTTAVRNNSVLSEVTTAGAKNGGRAPATTAVQNSASNSAGAGGSFGGASNGTTPQICTTPRTAEQMSVENDPRPADSPGTGAAETVPAGVLAALAVLALVTGKRRRS